jgi:two-component system, cell cycle sensor histidine kinase and response regulator CckA
LKASRGAVKSGLHNELRSIARIRQDDKMSAFDRFCRVVPERVEFPLGERAARADGILLEDILGLITDSWSRVASVIPTSSWLCFVYGCVRVFKPSLTIESTAACRGRGRQVQEMPMASAAKHSILIVEDDPGIVELENSRLAEAGYEILSASNAEDAMQIVRTHSVDLILLEYQLPGDIDGLAFFEQVRAGNFDIPVILITGHSSEALVLRALRAGISDFVTKSGEFLDYLPEAVRRVLRQARTASRLANSEARLASIIDSAKDAILVTEGEQRITLFNPAAERMFRCTAAEAIGKRITRFLPPEYLQSGEEPDGAPVSVTLRMRTGTRGRRADGEEFPLEASVSRGEVNRKKFYAVVIRDITERKRAEEALLKEQQFIHATLDSIQAGIVACDEKGSVTVFNRALQEFYGSPNPSIPPERWAERFEPYGTASAAELPAEPAPLQRALQGETFRDLELEVYSRKRGRRQHLVSGRPILAPNGRKLGAVLAIHDVTEQHRADERIREPIIVRDLDDNILFWNRGAEDLYGWTAAEALGHNARELFSRIPTPELEEAHREVLEKGNWTGELRQVTKDGREVVVQSRRTLLRHESGQPKAKLMIDTDITDQKKLESQLLHAQRMESIGVLASGVAHDFNNLLTVISGYSEILLNQIPAESKAHAPLSEIHRAGERAAGLTRQLLAFGRKQILSPQIMNLNNLVAETERMLRRLIGADIDLAKSLDPLLWPIKADPGQVEQVILNLVVNARDAMPKGGHITIETRNVELDSAYVRRYVDVKEGAYVVLAVTDTGAGMDAETKTRIFEPFFTTKEVGKGTGLGLATVHGIVKQSGGHVEVYSELGHGTSFKIYLPRVEGAATDRTSSVSAPPPGGVETILLVEDGPDVLELTRASLVSRGYSVLTASDGEQALKIVAGHPAHIHLLVTDVVMPRMSGRELAEKLTHDRPGLKVLYMSGYTDDAVVRHGVLKSGVAFLQKPFTPIVLARKVRELLGSAADTKP